MWSALTLKLWPIATFSKCKRDLSIYQVLNTELVCLKSTAPMFTKDATTIPWLFSMNCSSTLWSKPKLYFFIRTTKVFLLHIAMEMLFMNPKLNSVNRMFIRIVSVWGSKKKSKAASSKPPSEAQTTKNNIIQALNKLMNKEALSLITLKFTPMSQYRKTSLWGPHKYG